MAAAAPILQSDLSPGGIATLPPSKKSVYVAYPSVRRLIYRPAPTPSRRPKHLLYGVIGHPKLRLLRPIPVEIAQRGKQFLALFEKADEYGTGATMSQALEDLGQSIADLYLSLRAQQGSLGTDLKKLYELLSVYVAPR